MPVAGNAIRVAWQMRDTSEAALTGMAKDTDVTIVLLYETSAGFVTASETVTWTEAGPDGWYTMEFTPETSGRYILDMLEINASSNERHPRWDFEITAAGTVFAPAYSGAFCAESDIERYLQRSIDSTTHPSDSEAAAFAVGRAAILMSLCAGWNYTVTPSTVTSGSRLQDLLREANAIGAALDYVSAQELGVSPSRTEQAALLQNQWVMYVGGAPEGLVTILPGFLEMEVKANLISLSTDNIQSGDTVAYSEGSAPTNLPIGIGMGDTF